MKLHDLLDVMDAQMRIEIILMGVDAYGVTFKVFDGKADYIPISVLREYGDYDVSGIDELSVNKYDVKFDENGNLLFTFKNAIRIFVRR